MGPTYGPLILYNLGPKWAHKMNSYMGPTWSPLCTHR